MKLTIDAKHFSELLKALKAQLEEVTLTIEGDVLTIEGVSTSMTNLVRYERKLPQASEKKIRGGFRPAELHRAIAKQKEDVISDITDNGVSLILGKRTLFFPWLIDSEKKMPPKDHFKPTFSAVVDLEELGDCIDAVAAVGGDESVIRHEEDHLVVEGFASNGAKAASVIEVVQASTKERSKFGNDILRKALSFRGCDCRIGIANDYPMTLSWSGDGWTMQSVVAPVVDNNF